MSVSSSCRSHQLLLLLLGVSHCLQHAVPARPSPDVTSGICRPPLPPPRTISRVGTATTTTNNHHPTCTRPHPPGGCSGAMLPRVARPLLALGAAAAVPVVAAFSEQPQLAQRGALSMLAAKLRATSPSAAASEAADALEALGGLLDVAESKIKAGLGGAEAAGARERAASGDQARRRAANRAPRPAPLLGLKGVNAEEGEALLLRPPTPPV